LTKRLSKRPKRRRCGTHPSSPAERKVFLTTVCRAGNGGMSGGWLTAPVVPTAEEDRKAHDKLVQLRAIDHLRTCKMWRLGPCAFEGCNTTAAVVFHDLPLLLEGKRKYNPLETRMPRRVCPKSDSERLQDLFESRDPAMLRKLPMLTERFKHRLTDLLEEELEKRHLPPNWCIVCIEAQKLRRKHSQFCQLKRGTCLMPLCLALRERNVAIEAERPTEAQVRERRRGASEWWIVECWHATFIAPGVCLIQMFCPSIDEKCVTKWNAMMGCTCVFIWCIAIMVFFFLGPGVDT
jgi:hypothetical protein